MKKYDVIVVGGGGGVKVGRPVGDLGLKVAFIEKGPLGGTCLNRGCIPSKMLIHVADVASVIRDAHRFDIHVDSNFTVDFEKLVTRVSKEIDAEAASPLPLYEAHQNVDLYRHEAKFISNKVLEVNGEGITADKIFLAVGGRSQVPPIKGLDGTPYMTSESFLRNTKKPKKLIVIGGGYIAAELGYFYAALGVETHFIVREMMLRAEDTEVRQEFERAFADQFPVHFGYRPQEVSYEGGEFSVLCTNDDGIKKEFIGDALLVATGIKPWTDQLGIENTDIALDKKGFIKVDDYLRTNVEGVWAFGDCIGRYLFRHTVNFEGDYLFRTIFSDPLDEAIDYRPVPHAVFTHPQVAGVGKTEDQLKAEGADYVVGLNHYKDSAMGMALLSEYGFVKLLFCGKSRKLLGAHIVGDEASNMVHMLIAYQNMNATLDDILNTIYIHPALPEIVRNAARKAAVRFIEREKVGP
ncbi:MAG: mycothione reductase [Chlamydiales bacterium]|jgi:mycothione reductase